MKIVLLQNIEAAIADDNTGELETLNELLTAKQKELVKLAQSKRITWLSPMSLTDLKKRSRSYW